MAPACSTPTLVEVARRRQATDADRQGHRNVQDDVHVIYTITDWDVLNFTDEVKRKLASRSDFQSGVRYGSSFSQAALGALAGAAKVLGWGVSTASGLGLGSTFIFGAGQIFDAKGHAQAYEQSYTAVQAAEATFYFHQLGMGFTTDSNGKKIVAPGSPLGRPGIPSRTNLTPDGETLYYRVSKILKVLEDTLAAKIPDLQDLKEATGDTSGTAAPAKATEAQPVKPQATPTPPPAPTSPPAPTATPAPQSAAPPPPGPPAVTAAGARHDQPRPAGSVHSAPADPADPADPFHAWLSAHADSLELPPSLDDPAHRNDWSRTQAALMP